MLTRFTLERIEPIPKQRKFVQNWWLQHRRQGAVYDGISHLTKTEIIPIDQSA